MSDKGSVYAASGREQAELQRRLDHVVTTQESLRQDRERLREASQEFERALGRPRTVLGTERFNESLGKPHV